MNEKISNILIVIIVFVVLFIGAGIIWGGTGFWAAGFAGGAGIAGIFIGRAGKGSGGGSFNNASASTDEAIHSGFQDINKRVDDLQDELSDTERRTAKLERKYKGVSEQLVDGIRKGTISFHDENGNIIPHGGDISDSGSD